MLSLNTCFVSEIRWGNGACLWAEEIPAVCMSAVSCRSILMFHSRCSMNTESQWTHDVWEFTETQKLLLVLSKQGTGSPRGRAFYSNQNFLRMQKAALVFWEAQMTYSFLFMLLPCVSLSLNAENDDRRKKIEQLIIPFPFSISTFLVRMKYTWTYELQSINCVISMI